MESLSFYVVSFLLRRVIFDGVLFSPLPNIQVPKVFKKTASKDVHTISKRKEDQNVKIPIICTAVLIATSSSVDFSRCVFQLGV